MSQRTALFLPLDKEFDKVISSGPALIEFWKKIYETPASRRYWDEVVRELNTKIYSSETFEFFIEYLDFVKKLDSIEKEKITLKDWQNIYDKWINVTTKIKPFNTHQKINLVGEAVGALEEINEEILRRSKDKPLDFDIGFDTIYATNTMRGKLSAPEALRLAAGDAFVLSCNAVEARVIITDTLRKRFEQKEEKKDKKEEKKEKKDKKAEKKEKKKEEKKEKKEEEKKEKRFKK